MADDATDAPEEEAPKKKTTRRKATPKTPKASSAASAGSDSASKDPKEVPADSAAAPEPGASEESESAPTPEEEAAKSAAAAKTAAEERQATDSASEDTPKPDESKIATGAAGAAAATAAATQKAKEKIEEVDWGYRGRQLVRGILMVAAGVGAVIAMYVIFAIAFVQWVYAMFTKEQMEAAAEFNARLALYIRELLDFIGYRKNDAVFPFAPFPELPDDPVADTTDFDISGDKKES